MLGFKDVIVTSVERRDTVLHLQIKMYQSIHKCPRCGENTSKVHDYRNQSIKDISAFGSKTIIHYRKRRYVCPDCNKRFYEQAPFLPKYHSITNRLSTYIINLFREVNSIKSVADKANVSSTTAARIFDHVGYLNTTLPKVLSLDEFRGNADGEKFQCIIAYPYNRKVLDILPNRKTEDLCQYFLKLKDHSNVKYVVIDMSGPFRSLAKLVFLKVAVIADRYHVVRHVVWAYENVRKQEQKKFHEHRRRYFKRSRKLILKRPKNLSEIEADQVESMLQISERLRHTYVIKNEFLKFMDCKNSHEAKKQLGVWNMLVLGYNLPEFNK